MPALPSLEMFALFMLTGIFSTLLLPETKGKSLEELSNEDQEGFVQGMAFFPFARNVTSSFSSRS
jgi:PHS family inorganic phosphate transporter-like MFS transporter